MSDPNHNSNSDYINPFWQGKSLDNPTYENQGVYLTALLSRFRQELDTSGVLDRALMKLTGDENLAACMKLSSVAMFPTIIQEESPLRMVGLGVRRLDFDKDNKPYQKISSVPIADKLGNDSFMPHDGIRPEHAQLIGSQAVLLMTLRDTGILPDLDLARGQIRDNT